MKLIKVTVLCVVGLLHAYACADHHGFWDKEVLKKRKKQAKEVRIKAAKAQAAATDIPDQKTNGDLQRYKDKRGSFSKALDHKSNGLVKHDSFKSMIHALRSGKSKDFDKIILGGIVHLSDPQGAYPFTFIGADGAAFSVPAAPRLTSSHAAGEMVELYWQALLRDIPFNQYNSNATATNAIAGLNALSNFKGPKIGGVVTPQTLFRIGFPGVLDGPYISQFLYQPIPDHGQLVQQLYFPYVAGTDYLTSVSDLLLVENGGSTGQTNVFAGSSSFIFNGRDMGTYVHKDYSTEAWINAALILLSYGKDALDPHNPYRNNPTQDGFVTYGPVKVIELVNTAAAAAAKAVWHQKWLVHLRLRPEYFGFLIQQQIVDGADYHLNNDVINASALVNIFNLYGTYLLPIMYPEGSPTHPSYPAAHAVISGACATILKAFFDEDFAIPNPKQPNASNSGFDPYPDMLRVGHELNKLASNIGMGRNFAGMHYRSDEYEGMRLGEKIAMSVLVDEGYTNNEKFKGYTLTKFNGKTITVGPKVRVD